MSDGTRVKKTVASFFGNYLNAPLLPEYAFRNAQQSFRFLLNVGGLDVAFIQDVKRPATTIDYQGYDYLGYEMKFPKKIKWDPISFTVIETHDERVLGSVLGNLLQKYQTSGYNYPSRVSPTSFKSISKNSLVNNFGSMKINTLDPNGRILDSWKIYNPMVSKITPSSLKYSEDALTTIQVEVVYDWAEYAIGNDIRPSILVGGLFN